MVDEHAGPQSEMKPGSAGEGMTPGSTFLRSRLAPMLPQKLRTYLRRRFPANPAATIRVGGVNWGDLRRPSPISSDFAYDRGSPVDRYYIENFLSGNADSIAGHVLEVKDSSYARRFGRDKVTRTDVLDIDPKNLQATIIADLNDARELPDATFDCIVLTQVLMFVYDPRAALRELHRSLKPGGVLLVTVAGITPIAHAALGDTWYWSFTRASMERLAREFFPVENLTIQVKGNVLAATAFLQGVAREELRREELDEQDPDYQVTIAVRAVKPVA